MKNLWLHIRFVSILLACSAAGYAQTVDDVVLIDVVSEKQVKLAGSPVVAIFYCNGCPYVDYYLDRIKKLSKAYATTKFMLINASPDGFNEKESAAQMKKYAADNGLGMPYISDKEQKMMNALGATKCPEAFVLVSKNGSYEVAYKGAIDDNPQVASQVSKKYLESAIQAVIAGKDPAAPFPRAQGCVLKKLR